VKSNMQKAKNNRKKELLRQGGIQSTLFAQLNNQIHRHRHNKITDSAWSVLYSLVEVHQL